MTVASGEIDLDVLLGAVDVETRPGTFTVVSGHWPGLAERAHATVVEHEGPSYVVEVGAARDAGAPVGFEAAWLTVTVHSSLEAVGLTAALSTALAGAGIACNVLAGLHHDHLLVPVDRADRAVEVVRSLSSN